MATILNNRSTLATDPIRNFRFLVTFKPQSGIKLNSTTTAGGAADTNAAVNWAEGLRDIPFGFTSVSGMAVSTDSIPYREGGYNTTVHQIPGQTSFAPLTLQRGVILGSSQNWAWMRQLFQTVQGSTNRSTPDNFRCDIQIDVLSHPIASVSSQNANGDANGFVGGYETTGTFTDHVSMRFHVYNAWITALAYSDLNAGDNAILVEQMTLVHEGFDVVWGKDLTKAGSAATIDPGF